MNTYAAFLRGIGPMNPNMRNEKLREFFLGLGFKNVQTVISSGNVLFETRSAKAKNLEAMIEKALPEGLGFSSTTIIRSQEELQSLVDLNPFKGLEHGTDTNLNVTFLKNGPASPVELPPLSTKGFRIVGIHGNAVCSIVDLSSSKTPDLMSWLDKVLGKQITTRTWKTVNRIVNILNNY